MIYLLVGFWFGWVIGAFIWEKRSNSRLARIERLINAGDYPRALYEISKAIRTMEE